MNYKDIQDALANLARVTADLEEMYIENDGEVTDATEELENQKAAIAELLNGDGIDVLGRWLKSKEDELKTYKAEKDAAARRQKSVENTIEFVKYKIREIMDATGCERARGVLYSFAVAQSVKNEVDRDRLNAEYKDAAVAAIRAAGIPEYVTVTLGASVSQIPENCPLPDFIERVERDTIRFTKPRGGKE